MALLEIPLSLTPAQRSRAAALAGALGIRATAEQAFLERISALSENARLALLAAALSGTPGVRMPAHGPAFAALGVESAALEEAELARLVTLRDGHLRFGHDLVRSTVI